MEPTQANTNSGQQLAILLSVLALIFSFLAWNKASNTTAQDQLKQIQSNLENFNQKNATSRALDNLEQVRNDLAQNQNYEQAQTKINQIRDDLKVSFINSTETAKADWQNVDNQLVLIDAGLKNKTVNVLDTIDSLIQKLKLSLNSHP